jgi:hypothetical protein
MEGFMVVMSITMFILGMLAFFDAFFNYGSMFRMIFASLLIILSVYVYLKTKDLRDLGKEGFAISQANTTDKKAAQSTQPLETSKKKPEPVHH